MILSLNISILFPLLTNIQNEISVSSRKTCSAFNKFLLIIDPSFISIGMYPLGPS